MRVFTARSSKRFFFLSLPLKSRGGRGVAVTVTMNDILFTNIETSSPSLSHAHVVSFSRVGKNWGGGNCELLSLILLSLSRERRERDYITVILISIVNTRTKLTLSSEGGKFGEWGRGVGWVLVEEKLIELVIDGRGYRPLSRNFKMSCKWNVIWSVDGMLEHLDRGE